MFEKINNFFSSKKNSNLIKEISNKYISQLVQLEDQISKLTKEEIISKIETLKAKYSSSNANELSETDTNNFAISSVLAS